jgi:hypothetical protein
LPLRHMKSLGREWGRYFCSRARIYGYAGNADSREIRSHGLHVYVIPAHVAGEGERRCEVACPFFACLMPFQDRVCVPSSVPVEGGVACAAGLRSTFFAPYEMTLTHMDRPLISCLAPCNLCPNICNFDPKPHKSS